MWTLEEYPRANQIILIIYKNGHSVGSLTLALEEKEDVELWKRTIEGMNKR